jgi:hypothetical protein
VRSPAFKRTTRLIRSIGRQVRWVGRVAEAIWRQDFAPLLLAAWAYFAALIFGPRHATNEFYAIAAQIIPLLLLAIALEARLLSVGFPDIEASIASIAKDAEASLDEIEQDVNRLADEAPERVAEWRKKIADQRERTSRELESLRQRVARIRPGFRRYKFTMRLYAVLTAAILIIGELSALDTVARGSYKHADASSAFDAIVLGLVAVTLAAIRRPPPRS